MGKLCCLVRKYTAGLSSPTALFKKRENSLQKMNVLCKQEEYILMYFYHMLCFSLCSNKRICIVILVILCWKNKVLAWHTRNGCSWPRCYIEGTFSASSSSSWEYSKTSGGKCLCHHMWLKCKSFTVIIYINLHEGSWC
jgi:hypothetical protein